MDWLVYLLPILASVAAVRIRREMVVWYAAASITGCVIMMADPTAWKALVIFCAINALSMIVAYRHWNEALVDVAFYMGVLYALEVVLSFVHIVHYSITGDLVNGIGAATGVIGFVELILVSRMHDVKGSFCELFNDIGNCCLRGLGRPRDS